MSSPELDKWLRELDNINRSEEQSRVTLQQIKNKKVIGPMKKLYPLFVSIISIPIAVILLYSFIFSDPGKIKDVSTSNNPYFEILEEEKINRSMVAKSKSTEIFTPNEKHPFLLGVAVIDDDQKWNKSLKNGLLKMKNINEMPSTAPQYDLLISFNKGTVLKFKLWIDKDHIILKDVVEQNYFIIEAKYYTEGTDYVLEHITNISPN
ncbi:hypothetical protein WMO40_11235 [Bacillaceae bacterium CLA-AA-H227]|uniref:Uncharacterized protein n=1 Tax=Robertmurraya yapensis (ex Hitch et al 2024) TaxID=3133160 RepID=A0ACC6SB67_9BACI